MRQKSQQKLWTFQVLMLGGHTQKAVVKASDYFVALERAKKKIPQGIEFIQI